MPIEPQTGEINTRDLIVLEPTGPNMGVAEGKVPCSGTGFSRAPWGAGVSRRTGLS